MCAPPPLTPSSIHTCAPGNHTLCVLNRSPLWTCDFATAKPIFTQWTGMRENNNRTWVVPPPGMQRLNPSHFYLSPAKHRLIPHRDNVVETVSYFQPVVVVTILVKASSSLEQRGDCNLVDEHNSRFSVWFRVSPGMFVDKEQTKFKHNERIN